MYTVIFDDDVSRDFRRIAKQEREDILRTIRKKLTTHPDLYGKPLSGALKSYRTLKTGAYRVVYRIIKEKITVVVVAVGFRRDDEVYILAAKRLGLI